MIKRIEGDEFSVEVGDELTVAIAWHRVGEGEGGDGRMFLDEGGEEVPELDEVVVGVFEERLARTGAEGYVKDHHGMLDDGAEMGHGRVECVTLHRATFNQHGTGHWVARYDAETGKWEEGGGRVAQATIPDAEKEE